MFTYTVWSLVERLHLMVDGRQPRETTSFRSRRYHATFEVPWSEICAITDSRILAVDETGVSLRYKDYRDNDRQKMMHLDGEEFVRRYLLHVLPKGFTRIRHYGFLAGSCRKKRLAQIREGLAEEKTPTDEVKPTGEHREKTYHCPVCKTGVLQLIAELPAKGWYNSAMRRR
jgi:hypothetical protein